MSRGRRRCKALLTTFALALCGCGHVDPPSPGYGVGLVYRHVDHPNIVGMQASILGVDAVLALPLVEYASGAPSLLAVLEAAVGCHAAWPEVGTDRQLDAQIRVQSQLGKRLSLFAAAGFGWYEVATDSDSDTHYSLDGAGPVLSAGLVLRCSGSSGLQTWYSWRPTSGTRTWWGMGWQSEEIDATLTSLGIAYTQDF